MSNLDELMVDIERGLEDLAQMKVQAAFRAELADLTAKRDEINASIARGEYLRLLIDRKIEMAVYYKADRDVFHTRLFRALLNGKAVVVGITPDLTINQIVYADGRYEYDQEDLGHMAGGYEDVLWKSEYTDGVVSPLMEKGDLVIEGLSLAR